MTAADTRAETIVVAVSPTSGSPAALRWAADEAERRGCGLAAVSAWRTPRPPISTAGRPPVVASEEEGGAAAVAKQRLDEQVRATLGDGVSIATEVIHGSTFRVLLQASETADLLVLDTPSRADFATAPLLAHRLVAAAECPLVIMPPATH